MNHKVKALLYILACVSLWGLIPVVAKTGQTNLDNHQFLFWSSLISFLVLLISAAIKGKLKELKEYSFREFINIFSLGLLGTYIFYLLLYKGYAGAKGIEVLVFQYTWPVLIVLLSLFILKERLTAGKFSALLLGFAGVLIVLTKGDLGSVNIEHPDLLALVFAGSFCFALFSVLSKKIERDPLLTVSIYFFSSTFASFISMLFYSGLAIPVQQDLLPVLMNGIFINGFSYLLWILALKSADASFIAPFTFLTPVLSAVYLVVFFDEPFIIAYAIGLGAIITGGLINSFSRG